MAFEKLNRSKVCFGITAGVIFLIMLLCNILTDFMVDDFSYMYSFADRSPIDGILSIFTSMIAHYQYTNGRVIAHFFVQLFLYLPTIIFKIINALFFLLQVYLIYKIANRKKESNTLLFFSVFGLIWIFQLAFGQVNLWLDGACNYLWCAVFELIFILPYTNKFIADKDIHNRVLQVLFIIAAFIAGAYCENASPAAIFMAFLFMAGTLFYKHNKLRYYHYGAFLASVLGFVFMMAAPSEWNNKAAEFSWGVMRTNFVNALNILYQFKILIVAFIVLLVWACYAKVKPEIIITSFVLFLGALCTNFIMITASYYAHRSAFFCAILLIASCVTLASEVFGTKFEPVAVAAGLLTVAFTFYYGCIGVNDIYLTHAEIAANESYIIECRENGIRDISVPMVKGKTKYSALNGLQYLNTTDASKWPNNDMARYYDVDSIIAY